MPQHAKGDKIRVKRGPFSGERGVLLRTHLDKWLISLVNADRTIVVSTEDLTNYSLAARRAWRSMPDRKVGRPSGSKVSDRMSVIFRIDKTLWNDFIAAEREGIIADRTRVINECLRSVVAAAQRLRSKAS